MTESQPNKVFDDIQTLCRDFRRQWKQGNQPRIEDYVSRLDEVARQTLFQNLLHVELEFRRRQGESPSSDTYASRFPHFGRLIRQAFFESTLMSMDGDAETPAQDETIVLGMPATRQIGEYELLRELGRGGFGVVYAAKHLKRDEIVALKTLPMGVAGTGRGADDAERLHKFRQEFRQLSEVNHPNLVGMQTLEVEGRQWFLTMDLVDGVDFLEYVRPHNEFDEERLRAALKQLVAGIVALHERSIVHRDLKPSNVLVGDDGRVTILDFGLVAELQQPTDHTVSMQSQNFAGTPRYAAPEQAAGTRSAAGDWYALGVMLYEALTGDAPFRGTGMQMIVKKQTEDAPCLSDHGGIPDDLATLVDQLLQREPQDRPDAATICELLGVEDETISYGTPDDSESHASTLVEVVLIGREQQLADLEQAKQTLLDTHQPIAVFVRGLSGEGKTSLIEKFLQPIRRDDSLLVLSGRCYDRESVPFKAVDCIVEALAAYLRSRQAEELVKLLPSDIPMLAQLFPVLRRVRAIAERSDIDLSRLDSRQIRYRAFAALRELLCKISRRTPVVMFVDDLQWGDADSAAVLAELLQSSDPPTLLLLGSYRTDEAEGSPYLTQWQKSTASAADDEPVSSDSRFTKTPERSSSTAGSLRQRTIDVGALSEEECLELCATRLGCDIESLRDEVGDLFVGTLGNPYFLEQVIEGFDPQTGKVQALSLDEIVERRLGRLHTVARPLLEAIAVAGAAVNLAEVANIANVAEGVLATTTHMRSEQLVRFIGSESQQLVDTYHDKIRETILAKLLPEHRRDLHRQFGEWLEATEHICAEEVLDYLEQTAGVAAETRGFSDRVFDLAYHFHEAGDPRGFAYQMLAGELSYQAYASEDAVDFLNRAEQCKPSDVPDAIQFRLWQRLATCHARLRMLDTALQLYDRALPLAPSELARAETYMEIACANATLAKHAAFVENCNLALQELGAPRPPTVIALLKIVVMAFRALCLPRNKWSDTAHDSEQANRFLQQRVHSAECYALFETPGITLYYAIARMGALTVTTKNAHQFAIGMSNFAGVFNYIGLPAIAQRQLRRAEVVSRDFSDAEMLGTYLLTSGATKVGAGETTLAQQELEESLRLLEKAGAHWLQTYSAHMQRHLQQFIGSSGQELAAAEKVLAIAEGIGDIRAQCWGQYDIAYASARRGDIPTALARVERAQELLDMAEEASITESIFLANKGFVLLQASNYEAAREVTLTSWKIAKRKLLFMEYNSLSLPLLIQSIVGPDWHSAPLVQRTQLKRLLRQARVLLVTHIVLHSQVHRSRGRAFWALGRKRKAMRSFRRAIQAAQRFGSDFDRAKSLLDLAAVQDQDREKNRRTAIKLLRQQESVIPNAERWLLGDQYDEQVVAPPPAAAMIDHATETDQTR